MSETLLKPDVGDAELITAVRGGDVSAYGTLFERHVDAARRLARQLTSPSDADDLVSDAFAKVLRVLQNGGGPDLAFRAYLLTAVRRLHVDKIRAGAKLQTTDDLEKFDPGVPFRDTAVEGFENSAAAAAFASLPERWQLVLWHTEVEGQKPAEVGALLGMSANSVSALAYRAREGLRQAFLNSHINDIEDDACQWTHDHLGPYVRNGVSKRDAHKVEEHLDGCRKCMAIYLELTEVNSNLSGLLAPIILGAAASGYLASGAAVKAGFLATAASRVRDGITSNVPLSAAVGVAAVSTVVGVSLAISMNQGNPVNVADKPNGSVASSPSTPGATDPSGTDPTGPEGNDPSRRTRAGDSPTDGPTDGATPASATEPAATDTDGAGDQPSEGSTAPGGEGGSNDPAGNGGTDSNGNGNNGGNGGTNRSPSIEHEDADYGALAPGQQAAQINVIELAGIRDEDNDPLEVTSADVTAGGGRVALGLPIDARAATTGDEGWITYYPQGYSGRVTIGYVISDGHTRVRGTIQLTVPPTNLPPTADNDEVGDHATALGSLRVDVLTNDHDPDGPHSALHITDVSQVDGWTTQVDDAVIEFTYPDDFAGTQDFTYTVADADGATTTATATVTVTNDVPVSEDANDHVEVRPNATQLLGTYTDPNGDTLALDVDTEPTRGTVTMTDGLVTYTADDKATPGTDTVRYTVRDTRGGFVSSTVTVQVSGRPNLSPTAGNDTGREQATANGSLRVDVLNNDHDPDGPDSALHITDVSQVDGWTTQVDDAVIEFTYPDDFAGTQDFTYTVADADGATTTATATVTVINDVPVSNDARDRIEVRPGATRSVGTYTDPNGDTLALVLDTEPTRGTVTMTDGLVTYTADDKATPGTDTVRYTVRDTRGGATTGTVIVTVAAEPANGAPIAVNDDAGTVPASKDGSVEFDVVKNDTDPDGDELRIDRVIGTHHGTVEIEGIRRHNLVFTYAADFAGTEEISYVVTDGQYESTATLKLTVVNDAPVANDDTRTGPVKVGESATIAVLENDTDANGDALTLVGVSTPAQGTATVQGGAIVYTPHAGAKAGPDTFTYTVRDARGGQATAQVRVTVARPQYDVAVVVIQDERDDERAHLTARITGYPDQGGVRLEITGQAINAIVGDSLPKACDKIGGILYRCDLTGLTGERRDVGLEVQVRGQERGLHFVVSPLGFEELPGTGANNAADWS